jgi:hypothetical protein
LNSEPKKREPIVTFFSGSRRFSRVGSMPVPFEKSCAVSGIICVSPIAFA